MPEGISPNKLNDISKVYLDQVAAFREIRKQETEKDIERWSSQPEVATEAVLGQDTEMRKVKSAERREQGDTRETPAAARNYAKGQKGSIAWWKNKTRKESFSDWRKELREVSDDEPETEKEAEQKVDVKKNIKNIVKINPTLSDAVEHMGGQLLEVAEVEDDAGEGNPALKAKQKQDNMVKRRVLMTKMRALRQGATGITASYEPDIEGVVEYFYEEGLNEEGIDLLIEEIGLDGFVDFVEESEFLTEEEGRPARRATVRAKKYDVVKKEVDKADAARKASKKGEYAPSYAKKETDVTDYGDDKPAAKKAPAGMKKAVARKKEVLKQPVKKVAPKPVAKKVQKVVAKVKTTQPTKRVKASKEVVKKGIRAKVKSLYDAGKKRHRKATQPIRVFGKGVRRGVGDTVKFAKKAKKAVVGESREDRDPPSQFEKGDDDRGNPDYMKSVSYADEEKWKRLQKMRKASKKASVRAKANEEVEVGEAYKAVTNAPDSLAKMNKRYKPVKKIKNPTDRPFRDRLKDPDYKVDVDEEKKALPKLKMYRQAGNLARKGDPESMKKQTKIVSVLNKETSKGYKDAALAKLRDGGSPKHQTQEDYKKLPVAKMAKKISDKSFKSGQSGVSTKSAEQTGKMIGVLDTHDPQRSKAKSKIKESNWRYDFLENDAYKTTVANLKKQFGDGVLASKQDFDNLKKQNASQPKRKPEKDTRSSDQKMRDAVYGVSAANPKGFPLRT